MKKLGVIGWPVSHSLSPRLHRAWLSQYRIDATYEAVAVKPEALSSFVQDVRQSSEWIGFNVTIPYKETVIRAVDQLDASAIRIGAVNTVCMSSGELIGGNTDAAGFMASLTEAGALSDARHRAVVLGAGGAARAVCAALLDLSCEEIVVAARRREQILALAEQLDASSRIIPCPWDERESALEKAQLLVNATSLGLRGGEALSINLSALPPGATVCDLVYVPLKTPLLEQAKRLGHRSVDGLGMLIHQAAASFEAWFGMRPVVDEATRKHLLHEPL